VLNAVLALFEEFIHGKETRLEGKNNSESEDFNNYINIQHEKDPQYQEQDFNSLQSLKQQLLLEQEQKKYQEQQYQVSNQQQNQRPNPNIPQRPSIQLL